MVESMEGEAGISAINRASALMPIMGVSAKHGHVPGGSGSSSSSSISSNSSGYDSATTTPTNNNYESASVQSSTPTTPVAIAEPIPLATIAAVTPYYNESASTQSLGVQHYQQQQQQQQYCKQNYYHSYDYQQTSNVTGLTSYDVSGRGGYDSGISGSALSFETYESNVSGGLMHKPSTYRNIPIEPNKTIPTNMSLEQPMQPQQQHQDYYLNNSMKSSNFLAQKNSAIMTNNGNKPQAAATPFFAQPYTQQYGNSSHYDTFRTKTPNEYHDPFADNANTVTYQAQHKYYPTAKTQIKESCSILPNYTAMGVAPKQYANDHAPGATANNFCTSNAVNHGLGSYDKYIYPTLNTRPPSLTTNTPVNTTPYHSNGVHSTAPSPWPWPIENITNNNGSLSPTAVQSIGHIPTATVAPTQASYLNQNAITSQRKSPYRLHHEMYNDKYRTICPPGPPSQTQAYPQQTYISPAPPNRNLWSGSHPQNLPTYNERLPYASHHMTSGQGLHHSLAYFSANTGHTTTNNRQACCPQPFQPQPCYFSPRSQATMKTLESIPMPSQPTLIHRFSPYQTHCKYANMTDEKINNPNSLYLNTASYDSLPPTYGVHSNHTYANSYHGSNTGQEIMRAHSGPIVQHTTTSKNGSLTSIPFSNDLNLIPNAFGSYVTNPSNHNAPNINSQSHNLPPPVHGSNLAKRALMDYRKHINPTATQQPFSLPEDYYLNNLRDQGNHQPTINTKQCNSENILNTFDTTQEAINIIFDPTPEITDITAQKLLNDDGTKNLSIRDFIENWNDDEEDSIINEEMPNNINEVLCGIPTMKRNPANNKEILSINQDTEEKDFNEDLLRVDTADTTDTTTQYAKLPDIVIDTEKSANCINLGNSSMPPSQSEPFALNSFDVEKELDQLQLKKCNSQSIAHFYEDTDDEMRGTNKNDIIQLIPSNECSTILDNAIQINIISVQEPKAGISEATVSHVLCQDGGSDSVQKLQDNIYKDNDSSNSEHSLNSSESTFEREYHSFIHKLNTNVSSNSNKEEKPECDKNDATFRNRFYKSINKYKQNEHTAMDPESVQKLKYNSIFPLACTRKSRYKKLALSNKNKTKFKSTFYRFVHTFRRSNRFKLLQQHIHKLRDNHLPLIKGNSPKKFSIKSQQPRTLQAMCITVINTKGFRKYFLQNHAIRNCPNYVEIDNIPNQSNHEKETSNAEDPHICTDPQCETCDVIRSLMETDKYESLVAINDNVGVVQSYNQCTNTEPIDLSLESRLAESSTEITKLKNIENIVTPSKLTMESTSSNCLATSTTISNEKESAYGFENFTLKQCQSYNSECLENFKTNKVLGDGEESSRLERKKLTSLTKENFINEKNVENINNNFVKRQSEQLNIEEIAIQTNLSASVINTIQSPLYKSISTKQQNNILEDRGDCQRSPRSVGSNTGEKTKPLINVQSLDSRDENNFVQDIKDNNNCNSETNAYITPGEHIKEPENQNQNMSEVIVTEEAMVCDEDKQDIFDEFKNDENEQKVAECNKLVKDNDNCSGETNAYITPGELIKETENQNQNMSEVIVTEEAMVCDEDKQDIFDEFKNDENEQKVAECNKLVKDNDNCSGETNAYITPGELIKETENQNQNMSEVIVTEEAMVCDENKQDIFDEFKNDENEQKVAECNKLVKDNDNCSGETNAYITPGELIKETENQNQNMSEVIVTEEAMICDKDKQDIFDEFKNDENEQKVAECNKLVKDNDNCSGETNAYITPGELIKEPENQNQNMSEVIVTEEAMVCDENKQDIFDEFKNDENEQKVAECNKLVKDNDNCSGETNAYITPGELIKETENQNQNMSEVIVTEEAMICDKDKQDIFDEFKNDENEQKVAECNKLVKDNDNCSGETNAYITPGELIKETENQNQNMSEVIVTEEAMICDKDKQDIFDEFKNDENEQKVAECNKLVKDNDNCSGETNAYITPGELIKEPENQNQNMSEVIVTEEAMVCDENKQDIFDEFKNNATALEDGTNEDKKEIFDEFKINATAPEDGTNEDKEEIFDECKNNATAPEDGTNEDKKEIFDEIKNVATALEDGTIDCKNTLKNEIVDENEKDALENIKQGDVEIEFAESRGYHIEEGSSASSSLGEYFKGFKEQNTKHSFEEDSRESFMGFAERNAENNTSNGQPLNEPDESSDVMDTLDIISTSSSKILNSNELNNDKNKSDSVSFELNELEALKKELIQNDYNMQQAINEQQFGEQSQNLSENGPNITTNDVEHIKQMLESDDELPEENNGCIVERVVKHNIMVTNDKKDINTILTKTIIIPKLSDLSRDALNSSSEFYSFSNISPTQSPKLSDLSGDALNSSSEFYNFSNISPMQSPTSHAEVLHEMTVEEALAEMYRQAGVLTDSDEATSVKNVFDFVDGDDGGNDDDYNQTNNTHNTQDIFLVNVQEILNSDTNLYIVQCDMNENILAVVDEPTNDREYSSVDLERVSTLQLIETPNTNGSCSTAEDTPMPETSASAMRRKRPAYDINDINLIPLLTEPDQDVSMIHHEEIVPDNFKQFLREEFFKYLHEKYVQRNIPRFYHANRILKKYKKFIYKKKNGRPTATPKSKLL